MPFSHHSHSGEFCLHASDKLKDMMERAIALNFRTYCLTEHMPRDQVEDLYPEELEAQQTPFDLFRTFSSYHEHATNLITTYSQLSPLNPAATSFLLAFEADYIRPSSIDLIRSLTTQYRFDFFIGSIHHVHTIPIDFDQDNFDKAVQMAGGSEQQLLEDYFDAMLEMVNELKPAVVGHFDLIRLFSREKERELKSYGEGVWGRVEMCLRAIQSYGGLLEVNSAAVRKGWATPYPGPEVAEFFNSIGGRFTLSDDAHRVEQVGLNYKVSLEYLRSLGVEKVHYLEKLAGGEVGLDMLDACKVSSMTLDEVEGFSEFWSSVP